ncbi:hypothetical protein RJZ56_004342 [Blastomyces dermatitidis]
MDNVKPEAVSPHFHEILGEDVQLTDEAGTRVGHNFFIDEAGQVEEEQKTSGESVWRVLNERQINMIAFSGYNKPNPVKLPAP